MKLPEPRNRGALEGPPPGGSRGLEGTLAIARNAVPRQAKLGMGSPTLPVLPSLPSMIPLESKGWSRPWRSASQGPEPGWQSGDWTGGRRE